MLLNTICKRGDLEINIRKRQEKILEFIQEKGELSVNELIDLIPASPATIRRDISFLSEKGLIIRSHGYVHNPDKDSPVLPLKTRTILASHKKEQIAKKASELVKSGMTVVLDSGSTCLAIALAIKDKDITVVTNSIEICSALALSDIKVICTGGIMENKHLCFLGKDADIFIENIEVDIGFIGATGVRVNSGFTTSSPLQYDFKKRLIQASRKQYIVFDSSKFYSANIYMFANYSDEITGVITNNSTDETAIVQLDLMRDNGLDIILSNDL
ncbi:DeoR/GlpR family DNA-binding transcription regulator [Globicatella sulfidifaciens]|nr:DeoR/GlpR family DNA-binding transcription regulator [Globicatella sulfidifaciens]